MTITKISAARDRYTTYQGVRWKMTPAGALYIESPKPDNRGSYWHKRSNKSATARIVIQQILQESSAPRQAGSP